MFQASLAVREELPYTMSTVVLSQLRDCAAGGDGDIVTHAGLDTGPCRGKYPGFKDSDFQFLVKHIDYIGGNAVCDCYKCGYKFRTMYYKYIPRICSYCRSGIVTVDYRTWLNKKEIA